MAARRPCTAGRGKLYRLRAIITFRPFPDHHGQLLVNKPLGFVEKHGLWNDDQRRHAEELKLRLEKDDIRLVRLAWADPHGASRAKAVTVPAFIAALDATATTSTSRPRRSIPPTRAPSRRSRRGGGMGLDEMTGSPNLTIVPDPGDLPRAAVGAGRRLGAVRRIFQQRRAVSFLAAPSAAPAAQAARRQGHELRRRPRGRMVPAARRRGSARRREHRRARRARPADPDQRRPSPAIPITPNPTWT